MVCVSCVGEPTRAKHTELSHSREWPSKGRAVRCPHYDDPMTSVSAFWARRAPARVLSETDPAWDVRVDAGLDGPREHGVEPAHSPNDLVGMRRQGRADVRIQALRGEWRRRCWPSGYPPGDRP